MKKCICNLSGPTDLRLNLTLFNMAATLINLQSENLNNIKSVDPLSFSVSH